MQILVQNRQSQIGNRKFYGWRQPGLNRRPRACKARALPTELCPRLKPIADAVVTPVAAIQQQSAHPSFLRTGRGVTCFKAPVRFTNHLGYPRRPHPDY